MKNIAVITGASSGMGKEYMHLLDKMNFDEIWGIALNSLDEKEYQKEFSTKVRYFAFDLTKPESFDEYKGLLSQEKPNIMWLINCSGFGKFGSYEEIPTEISANMIALNCTGLVRMTEYSLPYMQKGGRIIEVCSVAAFQPIPYMNVYGATKAFVLSYSRALNVELKPKGISITTVCPFWTKTNFFNVANKTSNSVVSKYVVMYRADKVVAKAVKDAIKRKELSIYGFIAKSQVRLVKMLPPKCIMATWLSQQKLKSKYWNKK